MRIPETNFYTYDIGSIRITLEVDWRHLSLGFCIGLKKGDRHIGINLGFIEILVGHKWD